MVADLVTQQQAISKSELEAIMSIGESTVQPYNRSKPSIIVTAIEITDEDDAARSRSPGRASWSTAPSAWRDAKGTTTTVPTALKVKGSFLVRVESTLAYKPVITWAAAEQEAARPDGCLRRHLHEGNLPPAPAHDAGDRLRRLLSEESRGIGEQMLIGVAN